MIAVRSSKMSATPARLTIPPGRAIRKYSLALMVSLAVLGAACKPQDTPQDTLEHTSGTAQAAVGALDADMTGWYELILRGQPGPARVRIRQRIDAGDQDSRLLFLMGLSHHWERQYTRAIPWLEHAGEAEPVYPPAWHFLGWSCYYAGRPDEAHDAFVRHLELMPGEGDSRFALGVIALESGRLDQADAHLRAAIELQRDLPGRRAGVGKALARRAAVVEQRDDDLHEAIALLRRSLEYDEVLYEAHYHLARLLRRAGDDPGADAAQVAGDLAREQVEAREVRPR